jgi:enolase-phosphatase E1
MFPYARRELAVYVTRHWRDREMTEACEQMARDAGHTSAAAWWNNRNDVERQELVIGEATRLMDADAKATGLKTLQGLIWEAGFDSGELQAHVYDDVVPALERWHDAGLEISIYSSGSIKAQKLFFSHTERGDLLKFFRAHYDTTIGSKKDPNSYRAIAKDWGLPGVDILFVSDVVAEINAARDASFQTALCMRPENSDPGCHSHSEIRMLMQIDPARNG